jgi:outer membrane protein assembly factor BamB
VVALDLKDGSQRWSRSLDGTLTAGPAADDERVFVADEGGVVYALDAADGGVAWQTRTNYDPEGDFAVSADAVTVRVGSERLESFDLHDGDKRWSRGVADTELSPVVVGDELITVSRKAEVSALDLGDGRETRSWSLPLPGAHTSLAADVPLGLVDGNLVIGTAMSAEAQRTGLFAFPVTATAERRGVSFGSEIRVLPKPPMTAPALIGDTLFVPGLDKTLYRSTGSQDVERVATSQGIQPGVAVRGNLMVTQIDGEFRGYPASGGDPLWKFPAQAPALGMVSAIGEDAVFLPEYGAGLAAASLDGAPLWFTPIDGALGATQPLPLPDGDVFYGSGSAARYDGGSGDRLWSVDGAQLFAPAAYSDGVVFADLIYNTRPSGLAAIDAGTGKIRWFHENANSQTLIGPAAAGGVVVYGDSLGLVTAFDAATGTELWRVQLSTPLAGSPVVADGRVYLAEAGRDEDVFQRDYRMSAHDLRTGAFLGAYQAPGTAFAGSPAFAGSDDGRLMLPTTGRLGATMVILEPQS